MCVDRGSLCIQSCTNSSGTVHRIAIFDRECTPGADLPTIVIDLTNIKDKQTTIVKSRDGSIRKGKTILTFHAPLDSRRGQEIIIVKMDVADHEKLHAQFRQG